MTARALLLTLAAASLAFSPGGLAENVLTIEVNPDGFGASRGDIHAVCRSAADQFLKHMPDFEAVTVVVSKGRHGPIALYDRGDHGEYRVHLDSSDTYWSQYAYQFAHELCHVFCRYEDDYKGNLWFEETLAEVASLYCLRAMATTWRTAPPFANWTGYAPSLRDYTDDIVRKRDNYLDIIRQGLPAYYRQHAAHLTAHPTDREKNGAIAIALLPLFEREPSHWNAIRWLNPTPSPEGEAFSQYLAKWHRAVPNQHRTFVTSLADMFGVELP